MDDISLRPILPLPNGNIVTTNIKILHDSLLQFDINKNDLKSIQHPILVGKLINPKAAKTLRQYFWYSRSEISEDHKKWSTRLAITRNFNGFFSINSNNKLTLFYPDDAGLLTLLGDVRNFMF